jgi:hypothetical protein
MLSFSYNKFCPGYFCSALLWWGLAESAFGESLESDGLFCVGAFGRNVASVAVKIFSHLIYFKNL